jgi:hypothetical protein
MHTYLAYGLGIHSELAMPQLADAKDIPADVTIRYGTLDRPEDLTTTIEASNDTIYIFMADVGGLRIRNGSEMTVDPLEGAEDLGFRFFISGIGLGLLLQQRGVFNLHASAVNIGGGAVAFIGAKFMGKSTTAASLHARGHALLTDDVLPIYIDPGTGAYHVKPGYPELKLWPDAVEATFGGSLDDLPKVHPNGPKRTLDVAKDFEQVDLPLRCIYVLEFAEADEPAVTIEPLSARAACMELVRHSFTVRIVQKLGLHSEHLQQCAAMVDHVPVRRLRRIQSLIALPAFIQAIEDDVAGLSEQEQAPASGAAA